MSAIARKKFKEMINLCYEEDFPELHKEIVSLAQDVRKNKDYEMGMQELLNIIPIFADDFSPETFRQLEIIFEEYLENE
jgi:hypothetical protein